MSPLFPALDSAADKPAVRFGDQILSYARLRAVATALARRLTGHERVAVWATPTLDTAVATVAGLLAGVPVVPVNPKIGERELAHIVADSAPSLVLAPAGAGLPDALAALPRIDVDPLAEDGRDGDLTAVDPEHPALIVYTSGTTGPPKGVVLSRRAVASTLDALADAWQWTGEDVVVHGLPLFHVHGLVLGVLGPLRRGGTVRHLGRFSPEGVGEALADDGTMLFGVPTMYHRLAEAATADERLTRALAGARLLVSGSAPLPLPDHERILAVTGRRVIERYGMTETMMNTSVRADGPPATGTVGVPLPGVEVRLVDDAGKPLTGDDGETVGEIQVRGPNLFTEYLNRPEATAEAFDGDWFRTGDMAVRGDGGCYRIVGRKSTDIIKSGGYKIGAGEIENALLAHPGVAEAAVTAAPDPDLGERIIAWIVPRDDARPPSPEELSDHVVGQLASHKRPREVRFLTALPRNDMGKVLKRELV
ncbi:acyl-CoA synthetase [Streptomyces litchfieldiae]|uniref:Acyl-CoA synthetase n=1 Tax=Streptomyces litchfieldiae TaxID=3075543 RepID=A0ABU2N024_9ACTN|nr:acyl-CoA synthetase [Streptomyces sp. DSM 44938]MDT0347116.1 acyl-CoA synthetase [Streptomyces sp. DSM 44938]